MRRETRERENGVHDVGKVDYVLIFQIKLDLSMCLWCAEVLVL